MDAVGHVVRAPDLHGCSSLNTEAVRAKTGACTRAYRSGGAVHRPSLRPCPASGGLFPRAEQLPRVSRRNLLRRQGPAVS